MTLDNISISVAVKKNDCRIMNKTNKRVKYNTFLAQHLPTEKLLHFIKFSFYLKHKFFSSLKNLEF